MRIGHLIRKVPKVYAIAPEGPLVTATAIASRDPS